MKIYTRCVYVWQPDGTLALEEAQSYDYAGPVALCKDAGSPPPAPDYAGAAREQGVANIEAARVQSRLSNPNINSPYGNRTVSYGDNDQSTVTDTLSPTEQAIFNQNSSNRYQMGRLGQTSIEQVRGALGQPFDTSSAPAQVTGLTGSNYYQNGATQTTRAGGRDVTQYTQDTDRAPDGGPIQGQLNPQDFDRNQVINSLYGQQTSRLDPQWKQREEATRTQLANQGLAPGGEAYTNAMRDQNFAKNDAYNSAINSAIGNATGQQQAQFGMAQGAGQFANAAQQQGYGQGLAGAGLNLGAEQQAYGQQMGRQTLGLQGEQQAFGQQEANIGMFNQTEAARLAHDQEAGQFRNQARQQSIQEQAYARSLPINEVTSLMSGSQVQGPQFQGFGGSSVAPAPIFNARQQQGQYDQGLYNSQVASANSTNSGLMSLAGTAAAAFAMY